MGLIKTLFLLPILVLPLSGCVIAVNTDDFTETKAEWLDRQQKNQNAIRHLTLGRSLISVESELGEPDFVESFYRDGEEFTVFFYRTTRVREDGKTTKDETTPLVFVGGELVGWGASAIDNATVRLTGT